MELLCTEAYYDSVVGELNKGFSTSGDPRFSEFYKQQLIADNPTKFKVVAGTEKDVITPEEEPIVITTKNFSKRSKA